MTKEQDKMLNDTINHFNSGNRSVSTKNCMYAPAHDKTEGCAIGRLIKDKALCIEFDSITNNSVRSVEMFLKLPLELQALDQDFLLSVQNLHDVGYYWNETGLNDRGLRKVEDIKNNFK